MLVTFEVSNLSPKFNSDIDPLIIKDISVTFEVSKFSPKFKLLNSVLENNPLMLLTLIVSKSLKSKFEIAPMQVNINEESSLITNT